MNRNLAIVGFLGLIVIGFMFAQAPLEDIHIPGGVLAHIGPLNITNTLLATWVSMLALVFLFYKATSGFSYDKMSIVPRGVQNFVEMAMESLMTFVISIAGPENGRKFFPL